MAANNTLREQLEDLITDYHSFKELEKNKLTITFDPLKAVINDLEKIIKKKQVEEIELMLKVKTSHPEAYATAIAIYADRRIAELRKE